MGLRGDAFQCSRAPFANMKNDGLPGLIMGMGFGVPGSSPTDRTFECLDNMISRPIIPKGYLIGDRAYFAGQKAERFHIPLRRLCYRFVADLRRDQHGIKDRFMGFVLIDGQLYCESIENRPELVNPYGLFEKGEITREKCKELLEERRVYQARITEYLKDGSVRVTCPAKGTGCTVSCQMCPADHAGTSAKGVKIRLISAFLPVGEPSKACLVRNPTIPLVMGARWLHQSPQWGTDDWQAIYNMRNVIESRNDLLKSARGGGLGDQTARLMRSWAG